MTITISVPSRDYYIHSFNRVCFHCRVYLDASARFALSLVLWTGCPWIPGSESVSSSPHLHPTVLILPFFVFYSCCFSSWLFVVSSCIIACMSAHLSFGSCHVMSLTASCSCPTHLFSQFITFVLFPSHTRHNTSPHHSPFTIIHQRGAPEPPVS